MANELTISLVLNFAKGNVSIRKQLSDTITVAGTRGTDSSQTIATSSTAITLGSVTGVPGMIIIQNLDATNYVDLSMDSGFAADNVFAKLLAGQFCIFPAKLAAMYAKANTAACDIMVTAIEL